MKCPERGATMRYIHFDWEPQDQCEFHCDHCGTHYAIVGYSRVSIWLLRHFRLPERAIEPFEWINGFFRNLKRKKMIKNEVHLQRH